MICPLTSTPILTVINAALKSEVESDPGLACLSPQSPALETSEEEPAPITVHSDEFSALLRLLNRDGVLGILSNLSEYNALEPSEKAEILMKAEQ